MAFSDVLARPDVAVRPEVAGLYATVTHETAGRRGLRSNGSEFTIETLASYHLHDVVHHLHDVGAS